MLQWIRMAREQMGETPRAPDKGERGVAGETTVGEVVTHLKRKLDGAHPPLTRDRAGRYGKDFAAYLKEGVGADVLYKVADRIAERWSEIQLSVDHAIRDVAKAGGTKKPAREIDREIDPEKEAERKHREALEEMNKVLAKEGILPPRSYNGY